MKLLQKFLWFKDFRDQVPALATDPTLALALPWAPAPAWAQVLVWAQAQPWAPSLGLKKVVKGMVLVR